MLGRTGALGSGIPLGIVRLGGNAVGKCRFGAQDSALGVGKLGAKLGEKLETKLGAKMEATVTSGSGMPMNLLGYRYTCVDAHSCPCVLHG